MAVSELFDEWTTYEKVVAGDYMHHRRYFAALADFLAAQFDRPIRVLDLGCGDAAPVVPLIQRVPVSAYVGVDPASIALETARQNLSPLVAETTLLECTMEEAAARLDATFDVIIASYALHHLASDAKAGMLRSCRELLSPGGVIAIIDVFRDGEESRAQWLDRWEGDARERFMTLDAGEIDRLVGHVRENDLPETLGGFGQLASDAGLPAMERLGIGPERLNGAIVLRPEGR